MVDILFLTSKVYHIWQLLHIYGKAKQRTSHPLLQVVSLLQIKVKDLASVYTRKMPVSKKNH
jgi:hypothetical protein